MKKVSLAEQLTDISDSENAKITRKSRARRVQSSEDTDIEEYPTKKKCKRIESAKKAIKSNIYPEFPLASNITRSSSTTIENNGIYVYYVYNLCLLYSIFTVYLQVIIYTVSNIL